MMSNVGKGGVFVRWKEKGIGVAERDSECGGPEGKETTSNIDHIYGSILTLPSQISTLSPPPLLPLSPSPFLSQKLPSSLCVQWREGGGVKGEWGRGSLLGVTLTNCFGALFYRRFYANLLILYIYTHRFFFFDFVGLQRLGLGFSSGLWQFDIFNQNLLIIYLWLWPGHTNDVFRGNFSFFTLLWAIQWPFDLHFYSHSYGFLRIIEIMLMIWIIGLISINLLYCD